MKALDNSSPRPFQQPFLRLELSRRTCDNPSHPPEHMTWLVDVNGEVTTGFVMYDDKAIPHPGEKLLRLCRLIKAKTGYDVVRCGLYVGSAGPTHLYAQGILFERMMALEAVPADQESGDDDDPEGLTIEANVELDCDMLPHPSLLDKSIREILVYPGSPLFPVGNTDMFAWVQYPDEK